MKNFNGRILFLDRSDINTDEIIPARYLTEMSKDALRPYLLEDLHLDGFLAERDIPGKSVLITRSNFGCGSSREHAPWALEVNGVNLVIAESFARIFRRNMYNCGMMAVELPVPILDGLFAGFAGREVSLTTDMENRIFIVACGGDEERVPFAISGFDLELVKAGGWVDYADSRY